MSCVWRKRAASAVVWAIAALIVASFSRSAGAARPRVYAIEGARIVVAPGRVIDQGVLVIRDGVIEGVGAAQAVPPDAEVIDGKGRTLYAGLIDPYTHLGMPRPAEGKPGEKPSEKPAERGPGRPNVQVRADVRAALLYDTPTAAELERYHLLGYTSALVVPDGGVFRGTSALVHLVAGDQGRSILVPDVAAHIAFETARGEVYPSSLMGVIALIRQTFEDARRQRLWEARWGKDPKGLERPPISPALDAVAEILAGERVFFEADDTHAFPRIARIAREFSIEPGIVGNGLEYEVLDEVRSAAHGLIVPVAFPEAPHFDDEDAALDATLKDLRRWDRAPAGPAALHAARLPFAFTTWRLRSLTDFWKNVRRAIAGGLPADAALAAITTEPARMLGVEATLGTLEPGKIADVVMTDGDLFDEATKVVKLYIDGAPVEIPEESKDFDPNAKIDPTGTWELLYAFEGRTETRRWRIEGAGGALSGTAETQTGKVSIESLKLVGNKLTGVYTPAGGGPVEFTWIIKGEDLSGTSLLPGGRKITYTGRRIEKPEGEGL